VKSRYVPLVKLKKKDLDRAERDLIAANNALANASGALDHAYKILSELSLPTHGSVTKLVQSQMMIQAQHTSIEQCREWLLFAEKQQLQMQYLFKTAMIDFEKFKYLELQETQAHVVKIKKEEAKMLDEIGIMTYKRESL
jgi:Flagellar FliJ protein